MSIGVGEYSFSLTKKIPFKSFPKLPNIKIETSEDKKKGKVISKLNITIKRKTKEEAEHIARILAENLANLLSIVSNIHTTAFLSNSEFHEYNSTVIHTMTGFRISAHPYKKSKIPKKEIIKLLKDKIYAQQIARLSNAVKCNSNLDPSGVIIELNLAMKEDYSKHPKLLKYKFLRNALGHDELTIARKKVEKEFGKKYFDFTKNNQFDLTSDKNKKNLSLEAANFLVKVIKIFNLF